MVQKKVKFQHQNQKVLIGNILGVSALTDTSLADYEFYSNDCIRFGLKPSREKTRFPTKDIPNFNEKDSSRIQLSDELSELEYKVANIANYFQNEERLVEHLNEVNFTFK